MKQKSVRDLYDFVNQRCGKKLVIGKIYKIEMLMYLKGYFDQDGNYKQVVEYSVPSCFEVAPSTMLEKISLEEIGENCIDKSTKEGGKQDGRRQGC